MEMTQLGQYECFGEDFQNVSNYMLTTQQLSMLPTSYAVISKMPTECYCIKKQDFYEYIDDKTRKKFMMCIRQYPTNSELRNNYFSKYNWNVYKDKFINKNLTIPIMILRD